VDGIISWHWHNYFEVAYVAEGSLECRTPDHILHLQKGEAVFINSSVLHMYRKTSVGPCVIYAHIFDSRFLAGSLSSSMYHKYIYPIIKSHSIQLQAIRPSNYHQNRMLEALCSMVDLAQKEPFGYEFQLQNQLSQFWCRLLTMTQAQQTEPSHTDSDISRIKDMLHFIHGNFSRHITLQDIADAVNWAVKTGKVDPDRVYMIGGSGGGHAALLAAARNPHLFAAVYAACPPADIARWHDECLDPYRRRCAGYARQIESACGGTPAEKPDEYRERSAVAQLAARRGQLPPIEIITGIHDGHPRPNGGSVPVGHTIRAFNAVADAKDRISEQAITVMEKEERVPEELLFTGKVKFFNSRVWLRRTSGNVRVTLFEAGHAGNYTAGVDWFSRQRRGRPVDWSEGGGEGAPSVENKVTH
jgi:pimeloyl-ACP methyl ester carboxylesterase